MTFAPLEVVENKFYFGIGGMGDFLLLMSTFYDDIEDDTDVIFVCNSTKAIREMAKIFPKVARFWFFPRKQFYITPGMWSLITANPLCQGTGVTPKNFDYVQDWIKCGITSNVFEYYGVKEHPVFALPFPGSKYVVIQPFGGGDDSTKKKEISQDNLGEITTKAYDDGNRVVFVGSPADASKMPINELALESGQARWETDISKSYELIRGCEAFYGADSWGKTVACMAGKPTYVYENIYEKGKEPIDLFNHPVDPGNYVFLLPWKIERVENLDEE